MQIAQLRYFIEVCRWGNITKAAQELHISQPSVSAAIKELEKEFGVLLFQRINGRLKITEEGKFFLIRAYRLVSSCDELERSMRTSGTEKKKLTIGLTPMIASSIFPSLYEGFYAKYPDTEFEIVEQGSITIHDRLTEGSIDLAIALLSVMDTAVFKTKVLLHTEFCLCVSEKHPLAKKECIYTEDMHNLPIALLSGNTYHAQVLLNRCEKNGIYPNVVLRSNQLQTVQRMVRHGDVCTFLLRDAVHVSSGTVAIPFAEPVSVDIALIWNKNIALSRRAEEFIDFVKSQFS